MISGLFVRPSHWFCLKSLLLCKLVKILIFLRLSNLWSILILDISLNIRSHCPRCLCRKNLLFVHLVKLLVAYVATHIIIHFCNLYWGTILYAFDEPVIVFELHQQDLSLFCGKLKALTEIHIPKMCPCGIIDKFFIVFAKIYPFVICHICWFVFVFCLIYIFIFINFPSLLIVIQLLFDLAQFFSKDLSFYSSTLFIVH